MKRNRGKQAKDLRFIWFYPEMSESEVFVQPKGHSQGHRLWTSVQLLTASYFKKIVHFQSHYRISVVWHPKLRVDSTVSVCLMACQDQNTLLKQITLTLDLKRSNVVKLIIYTRLSHRWRVTVPLVKQTYNFTKMQRGISWVNSLWGYLCTTL